MRHLPVLWLTLVLTVLVTNRCAFCSPTISQLKQLIDMILFEDKLHNDILSEKVILEKTNDKLPKRIGEMVKDLNNVDPLVSLHALHTPHPYYSGENLNVSLTIVGKSIMCLTYKRVAFHLAMMISLIERQDHDQLQMRLNMLGYVIPFYIDMLSSIFRNYDDLLNVYDTVKGAKSDELTEKLKSLNEVIKSSCVVNEMKLYCSSFNLKSLNNCEYMFTDENKISLELNVDTIIETLMENENAILNYVDEMDSLRNMGMSTWKVLLKTPDLPPVSDEKAFVRTPLPVHPYRDEVKSIITEVKTYIRKKKKSKKSKVEKLYSSILVNGEIPSTETLDRTSPASVSDAQSARTVEVVQE